MSSIGILIVLVAIFLIFNADKLAWVFLGQLQLNTAGFETNTHHTHPAKG